VNSLSFPNIPQYHTHMNNRDIYPSLLRCAFSLTALLVTTCFQSPRISAQEMKYPVVGTVDGHAIFRGYCAPATDPTGKGTVRRLLL
jgi:hypothetical protein